VPETISQVLEIGVQTGASIEAWLELFPEAHITGIEVAVTLSERLRGNPRVALIGVSFNDVEMTVFGDTRFDLIVDDGSHLPDEQVATVRKFYPFLGKRWHVRGRGRTGGRYGEGTAEGVERAGGCGNAGENRGARRRSRSDREEATMGSICGDTLGAKRRENVRGAVFSTCWRRAGVKWC
jgi:hypothetical protein